MLALSLHHVSIPVRDLEVSAKFYENVLGLKRTQRPPFTTVGIWFGVGRNQVHLIVYPEASFRASKKVDSSDIHFAMRAEDFDAALSQVKSHGYDETLPDLHPQKMILRRGGLAGFDQLFIMDPDSNTIEINLAPFETVSAQ